MPDQIVGITVTEEQQAWLMEAFDVFEPAGRKYLSADEEILYAVWAALPAKVTSS